MQSLQSGMERFRQFILNNKFVIFLLILLLIGLNILIITRISHVFVPIGTLIKTVMLPAILTGIAYYLLNPIIDYLERYKIKRIYSIALLYLLIAGIVTLLLVLVIPIISVQVMSFVSHFPNYSLQLQLKFEQLIKNQYVNQVWSYVAPDDFAGSISEKATTLFNNTLSGVGSFVGALTEVILALVALPFILFYLLKDGKRLPGYILSFFPTAMRSGTHTVMTDMNRQISSFIRGQIFVSFCIGCLLYIGYLIIGLDYALVLAIIAAFTSVIPYLGPAIAITPALIVSMVTSPIMLLKMIVIWTIVQLIEGKFISPQIMGKSLHIHPVTIIFILVVSGKLFGVIGVILAVPGYALLKVMIIHLFEWFKVQSTLYEDK